MLLNGCYNTTKPMVTIQTTPSDIGFKNISSAESKSTFALAKLITDIKRGDPIFTLPAKPTTKGYLCNYTTTGDGTITYGGGKKYLGDWSTELGDVFYETLTSLGYNVAGDPSDLFNASTAVSSAEYLIGGRLIKISGNICEEHDFWYGLPNGKYSGEMSITVEWSVLNTLTKDIIIKKEITGYSKLENPEKQGILTIFENSFAESSESFARSLDLRDLATGKQILKAEKNISLNEITINQGKLSEEFNIDNLRSNVATVRIGQGHGSAFFIGEDGHLLTNAHVVGDANKVQIITSSGMEVQGDVLRRDKFRDVALIKVPLRIINKIFINLNEPKITDEVFAVGTPINESLKTTVTKGIISNFRNDKASNLKFIQSDAAISPGNSGGPLFDKNGNVIGISVAKYIGNESEGLGLFIPIKEALKAIKIKIE